jgi:hypothetical protein
MPHHDERPANALAHGPTKPDDIERARREVGSAEAQHAVAAVKAAAKTLRGDLAELRTPPDGR